MGTPVPRIPPPLKRLILPFWNAGHRFAWATGELLDAVRHRRFERCDVCGRFGPMLYRRRVIPPRLVELWGLSPRLAEALARKESSDCFWCGAKLRARRLARALLEAYPVETPPKAADSVAGWVGHPEVEPLRIAEINLIEGLHEPLSRLPGHSYSDYRDGEVPGTVSAGVRCEDLTRLTYADASFDVVLTSETLEHVPDLGRALAEIRRVLVPGGRHLFTVPLLPGVPKTHPRAVLGAGGAIEHRETPIRHPGGDVGYPVFTEFGADLPEILQGAGFEVEVRFGPATEDDIAQVFVCRKGPGKTTDARES
jgi:SAM-dependent methyltransferase